MVTICVFGDSIARGSRDITSGGWTGHLRKYVEKTYGNKVYNCGVSGDNTKLLLKRLEVECEARKPDIIIFAIGIGDSHTKVKDGKPIISHAKFKNNLRLLLQKAKRFSKRIIFLGLTRVDERKTTPLPHIKKYYYNKYINDFDEMIESFCASNNSPYISIKNVISIKDLDDGLHPTAKSHEKLFKKIKKELIKLTIIS